MSDYVSRLAVIETMMKASTPAFDENGKPTFLVDYVKVMEHMPSADVVEVKHGEWINKLPDGWQCSDCFEIVPLKFMTMFCWGKNGMNFCPNCGADMREKRGD